MTSSCRKPSRRSTLNVGRLRHTPPNWQNIEDRQALAAFLKDLERVQVVSHEEQLQLVVLAQSGDIAAEQRLVTGNLRLLVSIAHEYAGRGLPVLELVSEGVFGVRKALQRFDPNRGARFITYAIWWIKQYMIRAILNQRNLVRVPIHINNLMIQRARHEEALLKACGRATEAGIADRNGGTPLPGKIRQPISLDQPLVGHPDKMVSDVIPSNEWQHVHREDLEEARGICRAWFADVQRRLHRNRSIRNKHKLMFVEYFGLHGRGHASYKEIGLRHGVSKQAVEQVVHHAVARLWSKSSRSEMPQRLHRLGEALQVLQLLRAEERCTIRHGLEP